MTENKVLNNVLVAVVSVTPRIPCLFGDFVFDDRPAIINNEDVSNKSSVIEIFQNDFWGGNISSPNSHGSYRPLTTLTFRFGLFSAFYFHLVNLIIHSVNSHLVYKFLGRILKSEKLSLLSTLLFSAHPVNSEAICAIVGRADLLWSLFCLLSLTIFHQSHFIILILTLLSILSKEQGILVIPIILAVQWTREYFKIFQKRTTYLYLFATLSLFYLRLKLVDFKIPKFQEGDNPAGFMTSSWQKMLNYNYVYSLNFWILLCPQWLCYDWAMGCIELIRGWNDARLSLIMIFWFAILMMVCKRRNHLSLVLLVLPFIPSSNLFVMVGFVIAERNLYMCSLGFSMLICRGSKRLSKTKSTLFLSLLIIIFCLRSFQRSLDWISEESLFRSGLNVCPKNAKVHYNLAKISSNDNLAIQHYQRALDLWPNYEHALNNLGNIYKNQGHFSHAEVLLQKALKISPKFAAAWMNLGIVQTNLNKHKDAEISYKTALSLKTTYADCHFNLGTLYLKLKLHDQAVLSFEQAIEENPKHFAAHSNLVILLDELGRFDLAEMKALQSLAVFGDSKSDFFFHLANIYGKTNRFAKAEEFYKKSIDLNPKNPLYLANFGVLYHRWKKLAKAEFFYKAALNIDPQMRSARVNLASLNK